MELGNGCEWNVGLTRSHTSTTHWCPTHKTGTYYHTEDKQHTTTQAQGVHNPVGDHVDYTADLPLVWLRGSHTGEVVSIIRSPGGALVHICNNKSIAGATLRVVAAYL